MRSRANVSIDPTHPSVLKMRRRLKLSLIIGFVTSLILHAASAVITALYPYHDLPMVPPLVFLTTIDRLPDFLIRQHQAGISIHQRSVDPLDSERQNFFVKRPTVAKRRKPHKELQIKIATVLQGISAFRRTMKLNSNSHSSRSRIIAGHFSCSWQNP